MGHSTWIPCCRSSARVAETAVELRALSAERNAAVLRIRELEAQLADARGTIARLERRSGAAPALPAAEPLFRALSSRWTDWVPGRR